jgi:catechol 2,3-dioxygenase-like lactoylglutathione lyase family enzyme
MRIDHLALPALDPQAAARFVAAVLGDRPVRPAGPEGEFFQVDLADGSFLLFTEGPVTAPVHVAFQVERAAFPRVLQHLDATHTPYGNDPETPANGDWQDPHGSHARVYFTDPAGHFLEIVAP